MPVCSSPLEKQRAGRGAVFLRRFLVCHYKVMNHFHRSWAGLSSPKETNVIVGGKKGSLPVIQACVVSGYWSGPKHLAALPPLPDMCAQYALLLCGSPCGEGLAFYFKAAWWQVSREIGTFCLGWWNIIFFFERAGCCLKGVSQSCGALELFWMGKGRFPSTPAGCFSRCCSSLWHCRWQPQIKPSISSFLCS